MNVALVGPEIEENLSIRYLAASLEESGHSCLITPFHRSADSGRVVRQILKQKPGLVGLSLVFQTRASEFFDLAERLRRSGYQGHITAGGHFASLCAPEILNDVQGIDTILHHEGERRIVELADFLESSDEIPTDMDGITWRGSYGHLHHNPPRHVASLDELPLPLRRPPNRELGLPSAPLISSRGCAGSCSFCSINAWHRQVSGAKLRFRSPGDVATEMAALHREHGVRIFVFHDDDFIHPSAEKAEERCRKILDTAQSLIGDPFGFVIKCRPDDVREDLFAYLKARGLIRVYVGIETHATTGLHTLNRLATQDDNERALSILDRLGIFSCFNLLLFDPDTTIDSLAENLDFLSRHVDRPFDVARTELYAGAALERRMIDQGRAFGDYRSWDYRVADLRADSVFRLFVDSLWDRHFGVRPIIQRAMGLGYRLSIARRFFDTSIPHELEARINKLISDVNRDTLDHLGAIHRFVAGEASGLTTDAMRSFAEELRIDAGRRCRDRVRQATALSLELEARAALGRWGLNRNSAMKAWPRVVGRVASTVPYSALALTALICGSGCTQSDVIDPVPPPAVNFGTEIQPHLDQTCSTAGCHDPGTAKAGLILESGQSYANTVEVPSTQVPTMDRIEPFDSQTSYLYRKLRGDQAEIGGSGAQMPLGGQPDNAFNNKIRQWINDGAQEEVIDP